MRFALEIRSASLLLEAGLGPPVRTATLISRPILVKTFALAPSVFSFLRLMLFHLLCPDMGKSLLYFISDLRLRADGLWSPALWQHTKSNSVILSQSTGAFKPEKADFRPDACKYAVYSSRSALG